MKKTMVFSLFLVVMFAVSGLWAGENLQGKSFRLGIGAGYATFSDDQFDGSVLVGLKITYPLANALRVELAGAYTSSKITANVDGYSGGKLKVMPIQLSLQYCFTAGNLNPYIGAGCGYYLNDLSLDGLTGWENMGFEITEEVKNKFGFHFGGGIEFKLKSNLIFFIDVRYCVVKIPGTYTITDTVTGIEQSGDIEKDLNPLMFGAGISIGL